MVLQTNTYFISILMLLVINHLYEWVVVTNISLKNQYTVKLNVNTSVKLTQILIVTILFVDYSNGLLIYICLLSLIFTSYRINRFALNGIVFLTNLSVIFCIWLFFTKKNLLNLFIWLELFNIFLITKVLLSSNNKWGLSKKTYIIFITTNILVLGLLVLIIFFISNTYYCTSIKTLLFLLWYSNSNYIALLIYIVLLIKLGLVLGPKYNYQLYLLLDKSSLHIYLYYYYIVFSIVCMPYLLYINVSYITLTLILLLIWIGNITHYNNNNQSYLIFYWSNQIGLCYIQLLLFI